MRQSLSLTNEKVLQQARAYFAAIVESANDAIISKDLDDIITSWNPAAERMYGFSANEIVGKSVLTIIPPDRASEEAMILEQIRAGQSVSHFETVRMRKDGSRIQVSLTVSPVRDEHGRVIGASKIARDISGIVSRVRQQRAVAELGQAALEETDLQPLCERIANTVRRILDGEFCRIWQLTAHGAQVQTRSHAGEAEDPFPAGPVDLDPGRQIAFTLQSREPVVITNFNEEERFEPPAFLPRNISSGMSCTVLGEGKHPWGVLAVYADSPRNYTSDDVAFLQAVANILAGSVQRSFTERRFQLAFAAAPNGMVMVNEEGIIQIVNAQMEQMFGYSADEMIGRHVEMLLPDRYRGKHPSLRTIFGQSPEARAVGRGRDLFGRRKNGTEFPVEVGLNPAETPEGMVVLAAVIDISKRKRMESDLAEAHARLGQRAQELESMVAQRTEHLEETIAELESVSYSLSHDMRAPLRTIHSFSEIILEEAAGQLAHEHRDLLKKVINAASRLDRLIRDVLIYSRVSRVEVNGEPIDIEEILGQIIVERPEFQEPYAEITIESPLAPVWGHEAYLTQCFTNLLDNAVKFVATNVKPRVRIWTEEAEQTIRIWIEDNGPGIPEEARERVFGIFQRVYDDSAYTGTGIGLAIVRRAAERMGGKVRIEAAPEQGSRFCLELPRNPKSS